MKAFLDTSVLVAAFLGDHEHHAASLDVLLRFDRGRAGCGVHSLAEVYAVLTGLPGSWRASGQEARVYLQEVRERLTPVGLEADEYLDVASAAAAGELAGGAIYDALLGRCALKAKAEVLYTWNVRHFLRLGPEVAARVRAPG